MSDPVALIDMDGTIADFDGSMYRYLEALKSPDEDSRFHDTMYEDVPHIKARRDLIKRLPGFWKNLDRLPLGFAVLQLLQDADFHTLILTKGPRKIPSAWMEKVEWCHTHVPGMPIQMCEEKGLVYGKVLVDDWVPYVEPWLKWRPRGLVVMPTQPWNKDFRHPNVIHATMENLEEIRLRLEHLRSTC